MENFSTQLGKGEEAGVEENKKQKKRLKDGDGGWWKKGAILRTVICY